MLYRTFGIIVVTWSANDTVLYVANESMLGISFKVRYFPLTQLVFTCSPINFCNQKVPEESSQPAKHSFWYSGIDVLNLQVFCIHSSPKSNPNAPRRHGRPLYIGRNKAPTILSVLNVAPKLHSFFTAIPLSCGSSCWRGHRSFQVSQMFVTLIIFQCNRTKMFPLITVDKFFWWIYKARFTTSNPSEHWVLWLVDVVEPRECWYWRGICKHDVMVWPSN